MKGIKVKRATAGHGKTRTIANDIDFIASATSSQNYKRLSLYIVYTRANREEAVAKLRKVLDKDLIRTIHSLSYEAIRWKIANGNEEFYKQIMLNIAETKVESFNMEYKYNITIKKEGDTPRTKGDELLSLYYKMRSKDINIDDFFKYSKDDFYLKNIKYSEFEKFVRAWNKWKKEYRYLDFTDLLDKVSVESFRIMFKQPAYSNIFNLYIDEAQDLSEKMWNVIDKIIEGSDGQIKNILIVGDEEQCIYRFQGAEPTFFHTYPYYLSQKYGYELKEENSLKSYRCKSSILEFAKRFSNKDIEAVREGGEVIKGEFFDFLKAVKSNNDKSYMLLVRHNIYVKNYIKLIEKYNFVAVSLSQYKSLLRYYKAIEDIEKLGEKAKASIYFIYKLECKINNEKPVNYQDFTDEKVKEYYKRYKDIELVKSIFAKNNKTLKEIFQKGFLYPIVVATAHSSKGLEADIVFVDMEYTKTAFKSVYEDDTKESERNLYFVVFTRAKEILIYSQSTENFFKMFNIIK